MNIMKLFQRKQKPFAVGDRVEGTFDGRVRTGTIESIDDDETFPYYYVVEDDSDDETFPYKQEELRRL